MEERASMNTGHGMASHNDLTCDSVNLSHIDLVKSKKENLYYIYSNNIAKKLERPEKNNGFFWHEMQFYNTNFADALTIQRDKYLRNGQAKYLENCTMENWYKNKTPEEQIYQIGNLNSADHQLPKAEQLFRMIDEQARWEADFLRCKHKKNSEGKYEIITDENGNPVKCKDTKLEILDLAVHMGEATPHGHVRKIYLYRDLNNNWNPGNVNLCLMEAGLEPPNIYLDEMYRDEEGNPEHEQDQEGNPIFYKKGGKKGQIKFKTNLEKIFEKIEIYRIDENNNFILDTNGFRVLDYVKTKKMRESAVKQVKRINCIKSTWDSIRREHWMDVLEKNGFEFERKPLEKKTEINQVIDNILSRFSTGEWNGYFASKQESVHDYRRKKARETKIKEEELKKERIQFEEERRAALKQIEEERESLFDDMISKFTREKDKLDDSFVQFLKSKKIKDKNGNIMSRYDQFMPDYVEWLRVREVNIKDIKDSIERGGAEVGSVGEK